MDWKLSYDYEELMMELKSDIEEFDIEQEAYIYIVRDEEFTETHFLIGTTKSYKPIIDYYLSYEEIENRDYNYAERLTVKNVLNEMKEMNEMF